VRATLRTGSWWLADKACTLGATLLSQVVLVRVLGSAGFGELSYLLALASLLLPILQMGLAGLVVRKR
jgi:O-antigen/teichoic acid export membrane protein